MSYRFYGRISGFALLLIVCGACGRPSSTPVIPPSEQGNYAQVSDDDKEMDAAIAEAQRTLDGFIDKLQKDNNQHNEQFGAKVAMPTPSGGKEHIWIGDLAYSNGKFTGRLGNEPVDLPGKKIGDPVTVDRKIISDWAIYHDDGTFDGGYTIKVLMKREPSR